MPGFRDWFVQHAPSIAASANLVPDEGGLNIEGLAWDHERHALLFGARSPLSGGNPIVIPVRVKDLDGPWTTENLKILPPIRLLLGAAGGTRGIRSIEYVPGLHAFLVVVGRSISGGKAPFELYEWKGGRRGKLRRPQRLFLRENEAGRGDERNDRRQAGSPILGRRGRLPNALA